MSEIAKKGPFAVLVGLLTLMLLASPALAQAGESELPDLRGVERVEVDLGAMKAFSARGVERITVDNDRIAGPMISRDGRSLYIQGRLVGEAQLEVFFADDTSQKIALVVSEEVRYLQGDVTLSVGESVEFSANGVIRATLADDSIAGVALSDDGETLVITGRSPGQVLLHLYEQDAREPGSFRLTVESGD